MKESIAAMKLVVFEKCLVWFVAIIVVVALAAATLVIEDVLRWQACEKKELAQWANDDAAHKNDNNRRYYSKLGSSRRSQCLSE